MWENDIAASLNDLYGNGGAVEGEQTNSVMQQMGLTHIADAVEQMGPPPNLTPATARRELCGARAGYGATGADLANRAVYQQQLLSLPDTGDKVDIGPLLPPSSAAQWYG